MGDYVSSGSAPSVILHTCCKTCQLVSNTMCVYCFWWFALSGWQVFDNFESGLEPQFPPRAPSSIAQSSSTPSAVQVGGEGEGRGGVTVAGSKGQSSSVGRKRQLDDGGESENNSDEKPSDTNDDSKLPVGDGPPQAKVKKIEEEGDEKGGKKKKRKKRKKKNKESVFPYKVLHK